MNSKNGTAKRRLQMMELPRVKTIKQYDNFYHESTIISPTRRVSTPIFDNPSFKRKTTRTNVRKKAKIEAKINVKICDRKKVISALLYVSILLVAMLIQMSLSYSVSELSNHQRELSNNLKNLKAEVESLENKYISSFDLKQIETLSRNMGFVPNDSIEYIKINR